jgi:hypothetical protein
MGWMLLSISEAQGRLHVEATGNAWWAASLVELHARLLVIAEEQRSYAPFYAESAVIRRLLVADKETYLRREVARAEKIWRAVTTAEMRPRSYLEAEERRHLFLLSVERLHHLQVPLLHTRQREAVDEHRAWTALMAAAAEALYRTAGRLAVRAVALEADGREELVAAERHSRWDPECGLHWLMLAGEETIQRMLITRSSLRFLFALAAGYM